MLLLLAACSSHDGRAPVYDAKSNVNVTTPKVGSYIANKKLAGKNTYEVHSGDTMYSIAWRAGIDVNVLIKRNNLKRPYTIHTGQILKLKESTIKTESYSQKKQKISPVSCTDQSCRKNSQRKVVKKIAKEYSSAAVNSNEKLVKKKVVIRKVNTPKKVENWRWPSKGKLTKTFARSTQGMKGISISNVRGTPVYAAASGKVVYAGSGLRGYGNLIIIKHSNNYLSAYAHNEKLLIKENSQVKIGQKIALMGDSGTDNVRLHFDIRYQGKSVDPLRYLPKKY